MPPALVQPAAPGARAPGQGGIAPPGSLAATPVEAPVDVEEGLPVEIPLVYFYGHVSPADNPELYRFLVERLAALLDKRAEARAPARRGAPRPGAPPRRAWRAAGPTRKRCAREALPGGEALPDACSLSVHRPARKCCDMGQVSLRPSMVCRAVCRRSRCGARRPTRRCARRAWW